MEVVSYKGEVKEVMLWFGDFKIDSNKNQILATKLPEKITLIKEEQKLDVKLSNPKKYLYEPDPAFIKAHLIKDLANKFGLSLINDKIAYLTGDESIDIPILNKYLIKRVLNIEYKEINYSLSKLNIGKVDFKSRGVNIDLRTIHKRIRGKGRDKGIVVFTKVDGKKQAIICAYHR